MNAANLLALGAMLGVKIPRSLRPPPEPEPPDEEGLRRIAEADEKREKRRQKRLARGEP